MEGDVRGIQVISLEPYYPTHLSMYRLNIPYPKSNPTLPEPEIVLAAP
jgi:hypothetical protein